VRLYFSDPEHHQAGQRQFAVILNGDVAAKNLDVAQLAGGQMRGVVQSYTNIQIGEELRIDLKPHKGQTVLCGVEIIPVGDAVDEFPPKQQSQ
jgi:hypothetical protein